MWRTLRWYKSSKVERELGAAPFRLIGKPFDEVVPSRRNLPVSSSVPQGYKLQPNNVIGDPSSAAYCGDHLAAYAARVVHGSVPALAWRVEIGGKSIVFSGDTNGEGADLVQLAKHADLFIVHNAVSRRGYRG